MFEQFKRKEKQKQEETLMSLYLTAEVRAEVQEALAKLKGDESLEFVEVTDGLVVRVGSNRYKEIETEAESLPLPLPDEEEFVFVV